MSFAREQAGASGLGRFSNGEPQVYFARAVDGLKPDEVRRSAVALSRDLRALRLNLVDPVVYETQVVGHRGNDSSHTRSIVDLDLSILRRCDAVLMDMSLPNRNYIGCTCELVYAYMWRIPVVVFLGGQDASRIWLNYHATKVCPNRNISFWTGNRSSGNSPDVRKMRVCEEPADDLRHVLEAL